MELGTKFVHLEELAKLVDVRVQMIGDVSMVSRCNLCGSKSSSCTRKIYTCFMRKHLYTHVSNLYSCALCSNYSSNAMTRIREHVKKVHHPICENESGIVKDARVEMDDYLTKLAHQCFGMTIEKTC